MSEPDTDRAYRPNAETLALIAARCFGGEDGRQLMAYLRAITLERALGPDATDAQLRHLEGQRQFMQHLQALVGRGRSGPVPQPTISDQDT